MHAAERSLIMGLPIFAGLCEADVEDLLSSARMYRCEKRGRIFTQGEPAASFFMLADGYVQAAKTTASGEEIVVRYVSPGELFGLAPAIGLTHYPATAVAVVDATLLGWPSTAWPAMAGRYPQLTTHALRTVGAQLQDAHERVIELATQEVEQRIARVLTRLATQAGRATAEGVEIEFPLRRQDVAQLTGTTLHSASRVLSRFEARGLIATAHQRIVVRNGSELSRIADDETS